MALNYIWLLTECLEKYIICYSVSVYLLFFKIFELLYHRSKLLFLFLWNQVEA